METVIYYISFKKISLADKKDNKTKTWPTHFEAPCKIDIRFVSRKAENGELQ